jgi:hypothetical protein|tara:strand:+ start:171 stop:353 length:183 start_codon:yes stop_codon:yes gene_type:complete
MDLDESEVIELAKKIDHDKGEELAKLFIQLLDLEKMAKHQKRPRLVQKFIEAIDEEQGSV